MANGSTVVLAAALWQHCHFANVRMMGGEFSGSSVGANEQSRL